MKIGLITFHNAANYGAALQTYALQAFFKEKGYKCEYINYENIHRKQAYSMSYHIFSNIKKLKFKEAIKYFIGFPFMITRKRKFDKFIKSNVSVTDKKYKNEKELEEISDFYDKYIIGSDQVWNYKNNGCDNVYLLSFVKNNSKKISYSSSFGMSNIPKELSDTYKKYLSLFSCLSTREQRGVEIIEELTNRKAKLVLDPVFLLNKSEWMKLINKKETKEKYIFCYTNRPSQLELFFQTTGLIYNNYIYKLTRNISINDFINNKIKVKYSMSPTEFLSVVLNAEFVVTASFHCVAMSIIFNKPFVAILTGDKGKDERIQNLLTNLGLEGRILTEKMDSSILTEKIDYQLVNQKIEYYLNSSIDYLESSINL